MRIKALSFFPAVGWGGMDTSEFAVNESGAGMRLDIFLTGRLDGVSRSRVQAAIRGGFVLLNGGPARPSEPLSSGDVVVWTPPSAVAVTGVEAEDLPLRILYEDAHILAVDKAAGMVVHPGAGHFTGTLVGALMHHSRELSGVGGDPTRAGIMHRLDKETSGCLLVAKTDRAHAALAEQFAGRDVRKIYLARVAGIPRRTFGTIDAPIARHPHHRQKMAVSENERGREAVTEYRVLLTDGKTSLLECRPKTGRTHQIRVHLKSIGHPVLGDPLYGQRGPYTRHMLHAYKIAFLHPVTRKPMEICAPPTEPLLQI